jgi:hypothetical protein
MTGHRAGLKSAARVTLATVASVVGGLAWAVGAVVGGALLDGASADSYDAANRFAFSISLMGLAVLCPLAALGGYAVGRSSGRSTGQSLAIGQCAAGVPAVLVLLTLA